MRRMRKKSFFQIIIKDLAAFIIGIVTLSLTFIAITPKPIWIWIIFFIGIFFMGLGLLDSVREIWITFRKKNVPVGVIIGKGNNEADGMWTEVLSQMSKSFNLEFYRLHFSIERTDLFLHRRKLMSNDQAEWVDIIDEFKEKIGKIKTLEGVKNFHFFLNCPNALALGAGASIGRFAEVVLYHYFPPYKMVANLAATNKAIPKGPRILEDSVEHDFKYMAGDDQPKNCKEVVISVKATPIDPQKDAEELCLQLKNSGKSVCLYHIWQKSETSLEVGDDWILCAREILTLIRKASEGKEKIHLLLSAYMTTSFLIGMGLGRGLPVTVYQRLLPDLKYYPVLDLNKI
jgi:hypothetical protein